MAITMRILTEEQKARKKETTKASYLRVKERDKDDFLARANKNQKRYYANNLDKVKESKAKYYAANKEKIAEKRKAYRLANIEKMKEQNKASNLRNKEKRNISSRMWNKINADRAKENDLLWKAENKDKTQIHDQNKRARKRYNIGSTRLSNGLIKRLLLEQSNKCKYCKIEFVGKNYHIDHIMPLSLGGAHADSNIQLLCAFCNLSKNSTHPSIYERKNNLLIWRKPEFKVII